MSFWNLTRVGRFFIQSSAQNVLLYGLLRKQRDPCCQVKEETFAKYVFFHSGIIAEAEQRLMRFPRVCNP